MNDSQGTRGPSTYLAGTHADMSRASLGMVVALINAWTSCEIRGTELLILCSILRCILDFGREGAVNALLVDRTAL
jgi:hypothetical protein